MQVKPATDHPNPNYERIAPKPSDQQAAQRRESLKIQPPPPGVPGETPSPIGKYLNAKA